MRRFAENSVGVRLTALVGVGLFCAAVFAGIGIDEATGQDTDDGNDGWFNYVDYHVAEGGETDELRAAIIDDIDGAEQRVDAAISYLDDAAIGGALIDAAERGLDVRVVADEQYAPEHHDGFADLVDHPDISVVFGDGELEYLPDPNLSPILEQCDRDETDHDDHIDCHQAEHIQRRNADRLIERPASYNTMSHTFFVIDDIDVWNVTAPLSDDQGVWLGFRAQSEELANSYDREFRQMHGGVFATTLSVYNGPLKSTTHQHPLRLTNRGQLRVRFNPQERLVKNVIDETLRAKASVFVMTENLANPDLIDALLYKQDHGFDVRVMVGQGQATAPVIADAIEPLDPVVAPEQMGRLPTLVVIDSEDDRNGKRRSRTVQVLSHELWRAEPFEVFKDDDPSDRVRIYPSDTFADGVLWEIVESTGQRNEEIDPFLEIFERKWQEAQ